MIDKENPKEILQPNAMLELSKTEEGKKLVRDTVHSARTAMATQGLLSYLAYELKVIPRQMHAIEQQMVANIIYHCLFVAKHDELLRYIASIPDDCCKIGEDESQFIGNA